MSFPRNFEKPLPLAALAVPFLLAGCSGGVLSPVGPIGSAERKILLNSLSIMLAIVIPVILATLAFAWWFRATNRRARYLPTWAYSGRIELIIWSIPALVVFFLGGIAWIGSHDLDPAQPLQSSHKPLEVDVVSLDWKWLFIYPEQGVASVNRLVAPVGVPLHLRLTSATVLNVFFVPQLGTEIYTMNGMASNLNLQADEPGVFPGLAAHFSGDGFSDMNFAMQAVSPAEFAAWATTTSAAGPELDDASYRTLLQQTENVKPYTYRAVQAGLFDAILRQKLPPGDGPQNGRPNASVSPATTASEK
jgi:cytochrome o ubiquinol oxidase subunit II